MIKTDEVSEQGCGGYIERFPISYTGSTSDC
jgi:hypothetical protein